MPLAPSFAGNSGGRVNKQVTVTSTRVATVNSAVTRWPTPRTQLALQMSVEAGGTGGSTPRRCGEAGRHIAGRRELRAQRRTARSLAGHPGPRLAGHRTARLPAQRDRPLAADEPHDDARPGRTRHLQPVLRGACPGDRG